MDANKLKYPFFLFAYSLIITSGVTAQQDQPNTLSFGVPVSGSVEANSPATWEINAASGEVLSFYAQATATNSDPVITIHDDEGNAVIINDDFDYPTRRDALIEAFTAPRTGNYTVEVSSFAASSSNFTLTMFPGYANIAAIDQFENQIRWQNLDQESQLVVEGVQSQLQIELSGRQQTATLVSPTGQVPLDSYTKMDFVGIASTDGWQVGITFRQQTADNYYAFVVNSDGFWRFVLQTPEETTILRDWTAHNAINANEFPFSMGILTNNTTYEFYFNGEYLGTEVDESLTTPGRTGVIVSTANVNESNVQVITDNFLITVPFNHNGSTVLPEQIVAETGQDIIQELQRRHFIPTGGELEASIGESFIQYAQAGVTRLPVVRDPEYGSVAIGTDVTIDTASDELHGCGITFHEAEDESSYALAYVDNHGGYGISQFSNSIFEPGLFGERNIDDITNQHLVIISQADTTHYFVNRRYAGSVTLPIVQGRINNAVVNFEPADTTCTFRDIWVWGWG